MAQKQIASFLSGELDIVTFRKMYDSQPEINDFLQKIIDDIKANHTPIKKHKIILFGTERESAGPVPWLVGRKNDYSPMYGCPARYSSVRQCLTYELRMITHNVETAEGASVFYSELYAIYYQYDQSIPYDYRYGEEYSFALDVIPQYLSGGAAEMYIQKNIIPLFPKTLSKTARKKGIKAKIKEEFRSVKGYPGWAQSAEWPLDSSGKPALYLGKGKSEGDLRRYRFLDESTGEVIVVEQFY